jgi:hypothetical protein
MATIQIRKQFTASRVAALAGAGLIEAALIGAMLSGLGARIVREIPRTLSVVDIVCRISASSGPRRRTRSQP